MAHSPRPGDEIRITGWPGIRRGARFVVKAREVTTLFIALFALAMLSGGAVARADHPCAGIDGDPLPGYGPDQLVCGNGSANLIRGGWGDDVIYGRAGDDVLWSGRGRDVVYGGRGYDVCYVNPVDEAHGCEVIR